MNIFSKLYCRTVQAVFRLAVPLIPIRAPKLLESSREIGELFKEKGATRALIVTGPTVRRHGLLEPVTDALAAAGIACEIFDRTPVNPTVSAIEEAFALYRDTNCDALIAVGGGSPLDCAKGVCALTIKPKKPVVKMKGMLKVSGKQPPFVAVPTTAGTGSEATVAAVVTDDKTHHKFTVLSPCLVPKYALLDPEMTATLPPAPTAETGMDALTHAVEAYIGRATTKRTRRLAEHAVSLIRENLLAAYENGGDLVARKNMQIAAYEAGLVITRSYVGYVHAAAHSLGGKYDYPHGRTNATLLPVVLRAYGRSCRKKLARLARRTGVSTAAKDATAMEEFIAWIENLNRITDMPPTLAVKEEDIPALARCAAKEANPLYPVPKLMSARELEAIYKTVRAPLTN